MASKTNNIFSYKKSSFTLKKNLSKQSTIKNLNRFFKSTYLNLLISFYFSRFNYYFRNVFIFILIVVPLVFFCYKVITFMINLLLSFIISPIFPNSRWVISIYKNIFLFIFFSFKISLYWCIPGIYYYFGLYNYFIFYTFDSIITSFLLYYIDWVDYQYSHLKINKYFN